MTDATNAKVVDLFAALKSALAKPTVTYRVKYYDRDLSRKGQGVQVATFTDRAEAEKFAAENRIYARACKVEEVK